MNQDTITISVKTAGRLMLLLEDLLIDGRTFDSDEQLRLWRDELHAALPETPEMQAASF
ncbi:MAG: hypothetical protein K9L70_00860 [Thiohalocapsa sp.]|nr:hypothetical protein [Thiohalocapsa sp.]MCF7990149.1 hypothetical protein [Thiohalocapsa sp.]